MSWAIIDGELSIVENPGRAPDFTPPYPKAMWYVDKDVLTNGLFPQAEKLSGFTKPYPKVLWYIDDDTNRLANGFSDGSKGTSEFSEPYPKVLFYLDKNTQRLKNGFTPEDPDTFGAFSNALSAVEIDIPYETLHFGTETFTNAKSLTDIYINILAEYTRDTFGKECRVHFKNIQYYISKGISELSSNDDIVTFGTCETLDQITQVYDGGNAVHRIRTPENSI